MLYNAGQKVSIDILGDIVCGTILSGDLEGCGKYWYKVRVGTEQEGRVITIREDRLVPSRNRV